MKKLGFKKVWAWPDDVEKWIQERMKGNVIHAFCGNSRLGNLRIDIDFSVQPDVVYDLTRPISPFLHAIGDTVIADPPWKLPQNLRHHVHRNLRDLLKSEGILLFNAPWLPWIKGLTLLEYWIRIPKTRVGDCSIWSISQKERE